MRPLRIPEKAVCRYFVEPEYAARSVRGDYPKYLESLKKDLSYVNDLRFENGVYKKLLEYFKKFKNIDSKTWVEIVFLAIFFIILFISLLPYFL